MLTPEHTTIIMGVFLIIFGVIIPILDRSERLKKYISLRWALTVVWLALLMGIVLDFNHLSEEIRHGILISAAVISTIYLIIRSLEKALYNGWSLLPKDHTIKARVEKGDASASLTVESEVKNEESTNN